MSSIARYVLLAVSFVMLAASAGCSDEILASDFDQTCAAVADCVSVLVGDMCSCSCSPAAIRASELPAYNERRGEITCSVSCKPCQALPAAVCKSGVCSVE